MAEEKPELREILARLETVERQNRTFKRGGMVAAALLVAMMFIMGQAKPDRDIQVDTVKARQINADVITLVGQDGSITLLLPGFMTVQTKDKDMVFIHATSEGPSLQLSDKEGFQAELGASSLVTLKTGETHRTSAASVVLFGKDKKVLWSAP
jgi:hypothetical protein